MKSNCCNENVVTVWDTTKYYVCTKCLKPCDISVPKDWVDLDEELKKFHDTCMNDFREFYKKQLYPLCEKHLKEMIDLEMKLFVKQYGKKCHRK